MQGGGQPLPAPERAFFEPRFGMDLGNVRLYNDPSAAYTAQALRARAFTQGSHVFFGAGQFDPASRRGRRLLAHELAHVVQQARHPDNVVRRAEAEDRPGVCSGLTDIETLIDSHVNAEIAAARSDPDTNSSTRLLLLDIEDRLGGISPVSPIERFIESRPAKERFLPPQNLSGTRFAGAEDANFAFYQQVLGGIGVLRTTVKIHGLCVGSDKIGHFFQQGAQYYLLMAENATQAQAEAKFGRGAEIGITGLTSTGVYSNADLAANLAGLKFYQDLAANPKTYQFQISNYINNDWNEQANPNFYERGLAEVVWSNQISGTWKGPYTNPGQAQSIQTAVDLTATTGGSVTGTYAYPAAAPTVHGNIANGRITYITTAVAGLNLTGGAVSATPVSGIIIDYDWSQPGLAGKGQWRSINEVRMEGTWGTGSSTSNSGTWNMDKV